MSCCRHICWLWLVATLLDLASASITVYDLNNSVVDYFENLEYDYDRIPDNGIKGYIWPANPSDGCNPLQPPPFNSSIGWMTVMSMSHCGLSIKLKNAMEANFSVLILIRSPFENSTMLEAESEGDFIYDELIPAIVVSPTSGYRLTHKYVYDEETRYLARVDSNILNLGQYVWPFVCIVAILTILILFFMLGRYVRERRRELRTRLSSKNLKNLPIHKFKKGEDEYEGCAICLDPYQDGEKLRILPCQHAYHCKCVDPWLTKGRRVCPMCKRKITHTGGMSDSDSDDSDSDSGARSSTEATPLLAAPPPEPSLETSPRSRFRRIRDFLLRRQPPAAPASLNSDYGAVAESPSPSGAYTV